jgi:lipoate-protein ligase A
MPSGEEGKGRKSLRWRVLVDPPLSGYRNMATDHALALSLGEGEGTLRLYAWDAPTISFGRNEPTRGKYRRELARQEGARFVRRPTGGRAVLHDRELTYAVAFPLRALGGLRAAYRLVNQGLIAGIRNMGGEVDLAPATGSNPHPGAGPCFRQPAEGEVTALGRKLIGSAQVRMGNSVLQHGSIILDGDQELLERLRVDDQAVPPPATLKGLFGSIPDTGTLSKCIQSGLAEILGGFWSPGSYRGGEIRAAERLEAHYLDPEWTWRV